ncbi:MAG: metal ABC transporter permease [Acidobacteriota bacterium]|nr:metal ABC transporter permease [Acidobacteriota bacterium]
MHQGQILLLLLALCFALAAGLIGCFALMKRMLLASDVISHLALPGLGAAFLMKVNPLYGGAVTLFLGTYLVWQLQKKTGMATDASIGVVFAAALAIGAAVTPRGDLIDALFGGLQDVNWLGFVLGAAGSAIVVVAVFLMKDRLTLSTFSTELAASSGIRVDRLDLAYLLIFSLTVLIGLRFMGALLASSLIILPAAAARQFAGRLSLFFAISAAISVVSILAGFFLNTFLFHLSTIAPVTVMFAALVFAASLAVRRAW